MTALKDIPRVYRNEIPAKELNCPGLSLSLSLFTCLTKAFFFLIVELHTSHKKPTILNFVRTYQ